MPRRFGHVRVAIDDGVTAGKERYQPLGPPRGRPGDVNNPDSRALDLHHSPLRQQLHQLGLVHVPVHRLDRREAAELLEHLHGDEVTRMQDQISLLELPQALGRQPAGAAREVRVGDDGDACQR